MATENPEPRWKLVERVVALLEKSLTPDARLAHNEWLPDITTGHKRQCDVTIRYGRPPRETLSIVEVQERSSRVEIGMLGGWVDKMRAVGAQHLLCVSALDYPQSVKDAVAQKYGPSVKLLTLKQMEQPHWPIDIPLAALHLTISRASIRPGSIPQIKLDGPSLFGPRSEINPEARVFHREEGAEGLTILNIMDDCLDTHPVACRLQPGVHVGRVSTEPRDLWLHLEGKSQRVVRVELEVEVTVTAIDLPVSFSAYEQVNHAGTLAWAAVASGTLDGKEMHVRVTLVPREDGNFGVACIEHSGVEGVRKWGVEFIPMDD